MATIYTKFCCMQHVVACSFVAVILGKNPDTDSFQIFQLSSQKYFLSHGSNKQTIIPTIS